MREKREVEEGREGKKKRVNREGGQRAGGG